MAVGALLLSATANATLIGDTVNISLQSPNETNFPPVDLTDSVTVTTSTEISAGNGTSIGSFIFSNEFVDVQADRIFLRLEAGGDDGMGNLTTGFATGAYYQIGDLDFAGGSITGFDVFLTGIDNFNSGNSVSFLNGDTFRIDIWALWITGSTSGNGFDTGDIEIRLRTSGTPPPPPVPEPGTLALLGFGLAGLALQRRRKHN
jgi:hypothetical protein